MGSNLFGSFPATHHRSLIMRSGRAGMSDYVLYFREAADRLASSYTGAPYDDLILIPWLYMHRHSAELALKNAIIEATRLRRFNGEVDSFLNAEETKNRLKRRLGHKLVPLVDELDSHLSALNLEKTPTEARKILARLAQLDMSGEAFRYSGNLPTEDDRIDFPSLNAALQEMVGILSAAMDVLDEYADFQRDMAEEYAADYDAQAADFQIADYSDI